MGRRCCLRRGHAGTQAVAWPGHVFRRGDKIGPRAEPEEDAR
jgi:hypothetical protein